jgi:Zn finger protein HypA/HybF involved in hydrogenase expression
LITSCRVTIGIDMSILTAKEIWCDGCGEWVRLESGMLVNDEWCYLAKEGWTRSKGDHFCPVCSSQDNQPAPRTAH